MASYIARRKFLATLGGAVAWPLAARAQQGKKIPRIGVLWPNPPAMFDFMRQGLKDFGYVEGQNIAFEFRWAEGKLDQLPEMAAELVRTIPVTRTAGTSAIGVPDCGHTVMLSELGPRAIQRRVLEQARKLAEAAREAARDEDPISNDALYQRLVAPRKLTSVVELELRMRRSKPASALVRRSEPASALVSAANHMFWIIVLAILVVTASPLE